MFFLHLCFAQVSHIAMFCVLALGPNSKCVKCNFQMYFFVFAVFSFVFDCFFLKILCFNFFVFWKEKQM